MKKLTALFLSLSLLVCSFLFASAAEDNSEDANVMEPASEVFIDNIDNSYESLELESGIDSSAEEEIKEAIETFSEANDIKTETTTVGVTTEARETAEIQEVTTTRETAEPASDLEGVSSQEITETQETDANQETTESQEAIDSQEAIEATAGPQEKTAVDGFLDEIFNVTIEWSGMIFTYCEESKGTWNTGDGRYDEADIAHWESSSAEHKNYGLINVTTQDSSELHLKISFRQYDGFEGDAAIKIAKTRPKSNDPNDVAWTSKETAKTVYDTKYAYYEASASNPVNLYIRPSLGGGTDYSQMSDNKLIGEITIELSPEAFFASLSPDDSSSINPAEQPVFE